MWDVASVSFYVKLPLVPPQGLSLASECFLQTHYLSTFILNRQSRLGFNEGGEHSVSKSEFCQEEGGPGDWGRPVPTSHPIFPTVISRIQWLNKHTTNKQVSLKLGSFFKTIQPQFVSRKFYLFTTLYIVSFNWLHLLYLKALFCSLCCYLC